MISSWFFLSTLNYSDFTFVKITHVPSIAVRFTALKRNLGGGKTVDDAEMEPAVIGRQTTRDTA